MEVLFCLFYFNSLSRKILKRDIRNWCTKKCKPINLCTCYNIWEIATSRSKFVKSKMCLLKCYHSERVLSNIKIITLCGRDLDRIEFIFASHIFSHMHLGRWNDLISFGTYLWIQCMTWSCGIRLWISPKSVTYSPFTKYCSRLSRKKKVI